MQLKQLRKESLIKQVSRIRARQKDGQGLRLNEFELEIRLSMVKYLAIKLRKEVFIEIANNLNDYFLR